MGSDSLHFRTMQPNGVQSEDCLWPFPENREVMSAFTD